MKPLLIGFVALLSAQEMPGVSSETRALIEHAPAIASPLTGYLTLGEFFVKNRRLERARQIFAYGLLHAPSDPRFLAWLAVVEEQLGHADAARDYALAALSFEPGNGPAQEVMLRLKRAPSPGPAPSPAASAAASPAASPAPSPAPSPAASPSPATSPASSPSPAASPKGLTKPEIEQLAKAVGVGAGPFEFPGKPANVLQPTVRGDKHKALTVLKTVDAALKMYKLDNPKEEIKELDLKKLVDAKLIPRSIDFGAFPPMKLADGKLTMDGFGTLEALDGELKDFQAGLEKAALHREKGLMSESHQVLMELAKKFEGDPELLERLLRTELEMEVVFPAAETARKLFIARPAEPRNLWTLAVLYYRSSRAEQARVIAELMPRAYTDTFYTPAARALVALVDAKVSPELIQKLVRQRQAALEAELNATPAPPASPSPSPAGSPSPAASPSPAQ